jgi:hypothetical protein
VAAYADLLQWVMWPIEGVRFSLCQRMLAASILITGIAIGFAVCVAIYTRKDRL